MEKQANPLRLPGCGLPLNHCPKKLESDNLTRSRMFPNALSTLSFEEARLPMTTIREFAMMQFMNGITDKVDWNTKVNNPEITTKWKQEALESGNDITEKMIEWCFDELRYKASLIPQGCLPPPTVVYNGNVVKSDVALSADFKSALQNAVKLFEAGVPEHQRDWHPGSGQKVWDLVHPSLFPVIYGRTRILDNGEIVSLEECVSRCGQGSVLEVPPEYQCLEGDTVPGIHAYAGEHPYSRKFQWLPCEVDISQGESRIISYINNLHPSEEKVLYNLIEKAIDACIPLWDLTLAPLRNPTHRHQLRVEYKQVKKLPQAVTSSQTENINDADGGPDADGSDSNGSDTEHVVRPEPRGPFSPLATPPKFSLEKEYGKSGLQIIVKLANIELTPENPEYEGGSWHIEGQLNEHIVATALYYYSSMNITASTLSFRQWCTDEDVNEIDYEQDYSAWLSVIYGLEIYEAAIQDVGSIDTREGRLLTFPNILQHRVDPFKLADPSLPGHRKIVALFLVDPNLKIISTANIPCQRQDWWRQASQLDKGPGSIIVPAELQDKILEDVDFPISLREAKKLREELMDERKEVTANHTDVLTNSFVVSLCEH